MSKCQKHYFIGGAVCRKFESGTPAAEEMLARVVCIIANSFQMCLIELLESGEFGDDSVEQSCWRLMSSQHDNESMKPNSSVSYFNYCLACFTRTAPANIFLLFSTVLTVFV